VRPDDALPAPNELIQHLRGVRRALLRLHKILVDAERLRIERQAGPISSTRFLQALIDDEELEWLRPFSTLIVEIDEFVSSDELASVARVREYLHRVRYLVEPPSHDAAARYLQLRTHDPDVLLAHVELTSRLRAAGE
jgi:hypothetical protein